MAGTLHLTYPPHDVVSGHCVMASNVLSAPHFQNEAAAFAYVEARLWPNGPVCHHCGETERIGRLQGKTTRPGLYKCYPAASPSRCGWGPFSSRPICRCICGCK